MKLCCRLHAFWFHPVTSTAHGLTSRQGLCSLPKEVPQISAASVHLAARLQMPKISLWKFCLTAPLCESTVHPIPLTTCQSFKIRICRRIFGNQGIRHRYGPLKVHLPPYQGIIPPSTDTDRGNELFLGQAAFQPTGQSLLATCAVTFTLHAAGDAVSVAKFRSCK